MQTYTKEQILEILRKQKITEQKQSQSNNFIAKARAEHIHNEQLRMQKEKLHLKRGKK